MPCCDEQWGFCILFEHPQTIQLCPLEWNPDSESISVFLPVHKSKGLATTQLTLNVLSSFKILASS